tara:strand:+ start:1327 stop:1551 length:225 start_codon:yes stop_codon:yes gene_type:complete
MKLFEYEFEQNVEPVDDTEITGTLLYYTKDNRKLFKQLCKKGMEQTYNKDLLQEANISDFILKTLKDHYGSQEV